MKIRSITAFTPLTWPFGQGTLTGVGQFLDQAQTSFEKIGVDVQTVRVATPPFLDVIGDPDPAVLLAFAQALEALTQQYNIDATSIGPVIATTPLALLMSIHALPQLITETETIFSGVMFADDDSGINLTAAYAFAQVISKVAHNTADGIGNFRLGALANVPAGVPFFPAAYHSGGLPAFGLAMEAADLAFEAIDQARSLNDAYQRLISAIERAAAAILDVVDRLVDDHQIRFRGIDFSLAPFPKPTVSIAAAMERLGVDSFGGSGSLFATSFLTNAIREANIPHVGFSGVMLPVMEDTGLAERAAEGRYSVNDLLLYSAVCGTGLDTVPIPGDTSAEEIAAIFLDMATLAVSAGKPLTARLLPIPGLAAGDQVSFDSAYLTNATVLPVKGTGAQRLFQRGSFFKIHPRNAGGQGAGGGYRVFPGAKRSGR